MQDLAAHSDRLIRNVAGVTALEYVFIAGIISIAAVSLWTTIGNWLSGVFGVIVGAL